MNAPAVARQQHNLILCVRGREPQREARPPLRAAQRRRYTSNGMDAMLSAAPDPIVVRVESVTDNSGVLTPLF